MNVSEKIICSSFSDSRGRSKEQKIAMFIKRNRKAKKADSKKFEMIFCDMWAYHANSVNELKIRFFQICNKLKKAGYFPNKYLTATIYDKKTQIVIANMVKEI